MKTLSKLFATFTLVLFTGACIAAETKTASQKTIQNFSLQKFIAEVEAIDASALEIDKIETAIQKSELEKFIKAVEEIDPSALSLDEKDILFTKGKIFNTMSLEEFTASIIAIDPLALEIPADAGMYVSKVDYNKEKEQICCKTMLANGFLIEFKNEMKKAFSSVDFKDLGHLIEQKIKTELSKALQEIENEIQ